MEVFSLPPPEGSEGNIKNENWAFLLSDLVIWDPPEQDCKRSVFIPVPKKGNAKECSNYRTIALISSQCSILPTWFLTVVCNLAFSISSLKCRFKILILTHGFFVGCGPFLKSLLNLLQYSFCFMLWFFGHEACEILAPWPGIKPAPPALEGTFFLFSFSFPYLFLFLAALGLCCCMQAFSRCGTWASHWSGFSRGAWALGAWATRLQ